MEQTPYRYISAISGSVEVGTNGNGHVDLAVYFDPNENRVEHIIFSSEQARILAYLIGKQALEADRERTEGN